MPYDRDPLDPTYRPQPEAVQRGPPQFNGSNGCNFRCGLGCCEPSGGDGEGDSDSDGGRSVNGSEGATTLIGDPDQNEMMERTPFPMNFVVRGTPRPEGIPIIGEIERDGLMILPNGLTSNGVNYNSLLSPNNPSARSTFLRGYNGPSNSLLPEPSSGYMSGYLSTRNSNGRSMGIPSPMSPGLDYPGWHDEHLVHFPPHLRDYYFLRSPLRLSPQGSQAGGQSNGSDSGQDDDSIWGFLEDVSRLQAARTSNFL